MKKVVFIINTIPNQRCIKRINEFIENGYEVCAYSFVRESIPYKQPNQFKIQIIGTLKGEGGYIGRVKVIFNALRLIKRQHKDDSNFVYYYFGLDIAMFGSFLMKDRYFYEESDLVQTYINNSLLRKSLNWIDKKIIKRSFETIFTSEGFVKYHFGNADSPNNTSVIPNRLNKEVLKLNKINKGDVNISGLKIGFVGLIRYNSILNFAKCVANNFPQHEFHFYGNPIHNNLDLEDLKNKQNVFFHGGFQNPVDLPEIYKSIDLVLSTYDINIDNVKYAEPNKIYEAIFFHTPIIVSKGTFLGEKVERLGIGYKIDAMSNSEIIRFIENLTEKDVNSKIQKCKEIPSSFSVDNNKSFFQKIEQKLN